MRRTILLALAVAVPLLACDFLKKGDADAAVDAAAAPVTAAPTAAPTDTGGAATAPATPTGAPTLGGANTGANTGTVTPVAPKTDAGSVAVVDAGTNPDGGPKPAPTPTFQLPTFDGGLPQGFDAGALIPPGFDAGGFKLPGQK